MANQGNLVGLYVPTTNIWDVGQIRDIDVNSPEFKELLVRLYQNINDISTALNLKESAYYDTSEFVTGKQYFPNPSLNNSSSTVPQPRPVFRTVINFGALPNNTSKQIAHNIPITSGVTVTQIYGAASDTVNKLYVPLPYASTAADAIQVDMDATYITVTTQSNRTAYTTTYIVIEYMKY